MFQTVVSSTIEHIAKKYSGKATFYVCSASMGARPIKLWKLSNKKNLQQQMWNGTTRNNNVLYSRLL